MIASLWVPLASTAWAGHVGTVEVLPPIGIEVADLCSPFVVQTKGGSAPVGAVVDVEVRGANPVQFCLPETGLNPVLIDPSTGDLGDGTDGTIGGEAITAPGTVLSDGEFSFGVKSASAGTYDIVVFVEEPGSDNDDPDLGEPQDTAKQFVLASGGGGGGDPEPGATELVATLDCVPEDKVSPGGTAHFFFCRAADAADTGILGAAVSFDVTSGPNSEEISSTACSTTDADGIAGCTYTDFVGDISPPGTDVILAYADLLPLTPGPEPLAPRDEIRSTFTGAGAAATKVGTRVRLNRRLRGSVRSKVARCKADRKVVLKKVRKGRDRVIGRARTNDAGKFRIKKRSAKGRLYAVAKKKAFNNNDQTITVCKQGRSKRVRRRRR